MALLLTDDVRAAEEILVRVVGLQPELQKIGDTRLDRTVVQASREMVAGGAGAGRRLGDVVEMDGGMAALWGAVRDLGAQAREAWIFRELEGMESVRAARAMDCSRHALEEVHLEGARRTLAARLGEDGAREATRRLAAALEGLDAREALGHAARQRERARRRRRWVSAVLLAVLLVCFGLMIFVLVDLLGWQGRTEMGKTRSDMYSNPAPAERSEPGGTGDQERAPGDR